MKSTQFTILFLIILISFSKSLRFNLSEYNQLENQFNQRKLMSMPGMGGGAPAGGSGKKDEKDPKIQIVELKQKKEMLKRRNSIDEGRYFLNLKK